MAAADEPPRSGPAPAADDGLGRRKEEPERSALTDPPTGLRTPSPKYSYGTKNRMDPEKNGPLDRGAMGSNQ